MENSKRLYSEWLTRATEDPDLQTELTAVAQDENEIYERFYKELDFGTAGLRGVIGAGTNRMNVYTVRKATQGLADYLNKQYKMPAVAIAYDSRIKSDVFAKAAAENLAANGIRAYIFPQLEPVPVLSFAVRELKCQAGIMVTASHNPAKYNGYKCYGPDGCQMTDAAAAAVTACIRELDFFDGVKVLPYAQGVQQGSIVEIEPAILERYIENVLKQQVNPGICNETALKVVYTPLNGAGNVPVREILARIGIKDVAIVAEQELPDGNFPTAPYPNPEIREAFRCALDLAKTEKPDILLATDPDADRVGIAVADGDEYTLMSGNAVGCLLLEYILSCKTALGTLPQNPVVVKTIVTTALAARIAEKYGCELRDLLTGFKYIGEQVGLLEKEGHPERFVLGFEESYGYLAGSYVRDKDAVVASMLICEMAAYYKKQGKTLLDVYDDLCKEHGYYVHTLVNAEFEGAAGMKIMADLMEDLRTNRPVAFAGKKVIAVADYRESYAEDLQTGERTVLTLPKSNVVAFSLEDNAKIIFRPSGTEPKVKAYITAVGTDLGAAQSLAEALTADANHLFNKDDTNSYA